MHAQIKLICPALSSKVRLAQLSWLHWDVESSEVQRLNQIGVKESLYELWECMYQFI